MCLFDLSTFASQPHRAKTRVVLTELGSLSVEFTRLAQITKEAKYYDAIARITNEFDVWQPNTKIPGLWPLQVDASGCKKPDGSSTSTTNYAAKNDPGKNKPLKLEEEPSSVGVKSGQPSNNSSLNTDGVDREVNSKAAHSETQPSRSPPQGGVIFKREAEDESESSGTKAIPPRKPDCEPQGLASPPYSESEDFSLGGMADSTYEYLPKEYMLLGGLEDKYRSMYEFAADTSKERLLYRLMIPDEKRHILGAGALRVTGEEDLKDKSLLVPEGAHLTCFVGGMFALGAKIFERKEDMEIARRLTDGCVWAYEVTTTGIMPEGYRAIACPDADKCPWNETLWYDTLDPGYETRERNWLSQQHKQVILENENSLRKETKEKTFSADLPLESSITGTSGKAEHLNPSTPEAAEKAASQPSKDANGSPLSTVSHGQLEKADTKPSEGAAPPEDPLRKRRIGDRDPVRSADGEHLKTPTAKPSIPEAAEKLKKTQGVLPADAAGHDNIVVENAKPSVDKANIPISRTNNTEIIPVPIRKEFVEAKLKKERLPLGMIKITSGRYILRYVLFIYYVRWKKKTDPYPRPEAIESVFIMYRATGDVYWRDKGWDMFKAIEKYTNTTYGASAISDVTSGKPQRLDEMESFWLAETLKYFYLLFSDPSVVSLDDYVL